MQFMDIKNGRFYLGDCLEIMKEIPDGVIDMILCDLPYGTTACAWDSIIPFEKLWEQYKRICKENAAMVFTASQPFTTALIASNIENFKYQWFWKKRPVNFLNAKKQPLRNIEDVLVFCNGKIPYFPQGLIAKRRINKRSNSTETNRLHGKENVSEYTNYPTQVIEIINGERGIHPTQKPVELFEYLIQTYTNEGDLVLDNTAGSGTTAIAAENTGRKWVCIEQNEEYATKAVERILNHQSEQSQTNEVKIDSDIPVPEGEENGN